MKIIFIDIDGPLSWATWDQGPVKIADIKIAGGIYNKLIIPYPWNKEDCQALQQILTSTGARLVVSSDWRLHYGFGELKLIFEHYGIDQWQLIDTVSNYNPVRKMSSTQDWDRACQIKTWVKAFKPESWVAIDDLQLGANFRRLRIPKWRHVEVMGDHGMGDRLRNLTEEVIKRLNK